MTQRTVLISGAGVAGPTLAYWLAKAGWKPTLVERAPALRTGGYVIDFWGLGYDIAEMMGLDNDLEDLGYHINELRVVDDRGRKTTGLGTRIFREIAGGRFISVRRSDLARLLYEKAEPLSETIFGDEITALDQSGTGVDVTFAQGSQRRFDLVIGADGLHSGVRNLAFGPEDRFERTLGYAVAVFEAPGYRPRDEDVYVMHNKPGRMIGRITLRDDRSLFLFVFTDEQDGSLPAHDLAAQKAMLRDRYRDVGWEAPRILKALDAADDIYFDRVSQIVMPSWSKGRVALVGDAAFCVSLMAGQGTALAMTAAYVLAGELARARTDHAEAFQRYESTLRTFIKSKQKGAQQFCSAFVPTTPFGVNFRNFVISLGRIPGVARVSFGRDIIDRLELPNYDWR